MAKDSQKTRTNPQMLFDSASEIIFQRGADYGHYEDNLARIAQGISAYLGFPVTSDQVAGIMVITKLMRSVESPRKLDHYIDAIAYLGMIPDLIDSNDCDCEHDGDL
jgi:Domain of unknown function (DUF6378)